jgi:hypothetical protein
MMSGIRGSSSGPRSISRAKVRIHSCILVGSLMVDSSSLVSLTGLKRAYEILQLGVSNNSVHKCVGNELIIGKRRYTSS